MDTQRYKILNTAAANSWISDCPANVQKWQLLKDELNNCLLLQIKHFNSSEKVIKSVYVSIKCFDDTKDLLAEYKDVVSVQGVSAFPGFEFSYSDGPVVISALNTTNVIVTVEKVLFADGEIWRNSNAEFPVDTSIKKELSLPFLCKEQLELEYNASYSSPSPIKYKYEKYDNFWICGCGQFNANSKHKCSRCKTDKAWLEEHLDITHLNEAAEERTKKAEEEATFQKYSDAVKLLSDADYIAQSKKNNIINVLLVYKKANSAFDILKTIPDYKDSKELMELHKEKGSLSVQQILKSLKDRNTIITFIAIILAIIFLGFLMRCKHENISSPTCTTASICLDCNKEVGELAPHTYKGKPTCTELVYCRICNNPKSIKGEGDTTVFEHQLESELTCTDSAFCKRCNSTVKALGHDWQSATCTEPALCKRCNTEGDGPAGHVPDMEKCSVCGEIIGKKIFEDDKTVVYYVSADWFGGNEHIKERTITLNMVAENKSDALVTLQTRDEKINGKSSSNYICSKDIERNSKVPFEITITDSGYFDPLSSFGVKDFEDVKSLSFRVYLDGYYYKYYESPFVTITP